jgi:hypothetical protein
MRLDDVLRPKDEMQGGQQLPDGSEPGEARHSEMPAGKLNSESAAPRTMMPTAVTASPTGGADFAALAWHSTMPTQEKRPLWAAMPTLNRVLSALGGACLLLALGRALIPPVAESARQAYYPYTAAGKQEICLTRLRSVAVALATYSQDNDGRYPPLGYQNPQGKRTTWVSLVSGRTAEDNLSCPVGPNLAGGSESLTSSFVLNPVIATATAAEMDDASATLMLADGGTKHDVSLLPPYPSWPSYRKRRADGGLDAAESNFDFRHGGQAGGGSLAGVVYADGHAATLSSGSGVTNAAVWGGSAVLRRSRSRLSQRSPQAGELFKRLQANDVAGAASYLSAHTAALKPVSGDLLALWRLNTGAQTSDSVEKMGWNLAQAWKKAGDAAFLTQCNEEQTRRSQMEAQNANNSAWEPRQAPGQPSIRCAAPSTWKADEEREGRYRRLYLRSSVPAVYALLEVGERTKYVTPQPINWDGEEAAINRRYKGNYRRLNRGVMTLSGQQASVWEYEVEKPGMPRLRKLVAGYTDGWTSYVISFSAPAKDWTLWKPVFDKLSGPVATGYIGGE